MNRIASLALALFCIAGAASAQEFNVRPGFSTDPNSSVHKTNVGLTDVDMSNASGAHVALERMQRAAVAVCGGRPDSSASNEEKDDFATCYDGAMRGAVADAGAPVLAALSKGTASTLMAKN